MKKSFVYFALAAVVLAACTREDLPKEGPVIKTVLSIGSADTKTTVGDVESDGVNSFRRLYWAEGDKVAANGVTSQGLTGITPNAVTKADFSFEDEVTAPYNVVYPAAIYKDASTVTLLHNVGDQVIPMAGVSQTTAFSLNPLTGILQLKIKQAASDPDTDNIVLIEVSTASTRMSGDFGINYETGVLTPVASPSGNDLAVQITGNWALSSTETSFFIPVPAGSYDFTVKVMDKKGHYMTKSTTTPKTFVQGIIQPLKAFEFVPTASDGIEIDTPEKLIAFAKAYNDGDYKDLDKNLVATVTADLVFDATKSAAFNATGGIGSVGPGGLFNGVFDGGGYSINGLAAEGPLFARVGTNGTVKNLTIGSSSSVIFSADVASDLFLGSIVGDCKGIVTNCTNDAPVSCTSTSYSASVNIGGIVGRQRENSKIEYCTNNGNITFTSLTGTSAVNMGGIVGLLDVHNDGDGAVVNHCTNTGAVDRGIVSNTDTASQSPTHVGGVIGYLYSVYGATSDLSFTDLHHSTGNVYGPDMANTGQTANIPVVVGGIVGGIHGDDLSAGAGNITFTNSSVTNCAVRNNHWNNSKSYGLGIHAGGFVGISRGKSKNVEFSSCEVNNVNVGNIRGYGGGFAGYARESVIKNCNVLASSVVATAQLFYGGGIAGVAYNANIIGCVVTLTKNDTYSLRTRGSEYYSGGIAGWMQGASTISGCLAYVKLMYQDGGTGNTGVRGWIAGMCEGTPVIQNCGLGGTYGKTTASITLSASNYSDYIYGSSSVSSIDCSGCFYWGGTASQFPQRLAVIGDSISTFEGIIPSSHRAYYTDPAEAGCDVTDWTKTYWGLLIQDYWNCSLDVNTSWSGSSVASGKAGSVRTPFVDDSRLSLLVDPDCVILFGGTNDAIADNEIGLGEFCYDTPLASINHYRRFRDAYIYVIKYIQTNFPSAKIICIIGTDITGDYGDSVETIAQYYNLPCVDFRGEKNVAGKVTIYSGSHPDAAGHAYKAQKIYNETLHLFV